MKSANESPSRQDLFWHLVQWELRRLAAPLVGWLIVCLYAALLIHSADWSWPEDRNPFMMQARREKEVTAEAGMWLAAAVVVYLTGELFLSLRPGAARSRFALPPRRQDALAAAFLIQAVLVLIPFVLYYKGWVMARSWHGNDEQFIRQFIPPVPAIAAGLAFIAIVTGDWGLYLLISVCAIIGLAWWWHDFERWPQHLAMSPGILMAVVSVAGALSVLQCHRRWMVMAAWALCLVLLVRI